MDKIRIKLPKHISKKLGLTVEKNGSIMINRGALKAFGKSSPIEKKEAVRKVEIVDKAKNAKEAKRLQDIGIY